MLARIPRQMLWSILESEVKQLALQRVLQQHWVPVEEDGYYQACVDILKIFKKIEEQEYQPLIVHDNTRYGTVEYSF